MKILSPEELRLLTKVAKLYYNVGLNQDEIVQRLHLSRSKVSRLLSQAREVGVVKISVITPPGIYSDLETQIENRFRLEEVIVAEVRQPEEQESVTRELGNAAAAYMERIVKENLVIGFSWGSTLSAMADALTPYATQNIHIVQIIGGLGRPEAEMHATLMCQKIARTLSSSLSLLPAPGMVDNARTREAYLSDTYVQEALGLFEKIDIAFVGVGAPTPNSVMIRDGSIISPQQLEALCASGAVGDIALRFFDSHGQPVITEVDEQVIGIHLNQLKKIKHVVGVTGGPEKIAAILGALRGGLIDVLITDHVTAQQLASNTIHQRKSESYAIQ